MNHIKVIIILLVSTFSILAQDEIAWRKLDSTVFRDASLQNKTILLNLEANWCHWCHVMHQETYSDPKVIEYLNKHFISVSADQDGNPELAQRYRNYGWPAIIFLNAEGKDVVKRAGYISPEPFLRLLKAIVKDPSPEPEFQGEIVEKSALISYLEENMKEALDPEIGGFDQSQKYVHEGSFEYAISNYSDPFYSRWLESSMTGALKLSDPIWGGIYQYSTHNDWEHPHFEKLLSIQARYTRLFLSSYLKTNDSNYYRAAQATINYSERFLKHENGLFSSAQDADLIQGEHGGHYFELNNEERIKLGIPAIDTNTFSDTNADFARSLLQFFLVSGDRNYLIQAQQIQQQISQRKKSGFIPHKYKIEAITSLKDQLSYIRLLIDLIKYSPDSELESELKSVMDAILNQFQTSDGGILSYIGSNGIQATALTLENIHFARYLNWYASFTKDERYKVAAQEIYKDLTSNENRSKYYAEPDLILLNEELNSAAFTYVGVSKSGLNKLNRSALLLAPFHSLHENYRADQLPENKNYLGEYESEQVLFVCNDSYCSSPIESLKSLNEFIEKR